MDTIGIVVSLLSVAAALVGHIFYLARWSGRVETTVNTIVTEINRNRDEHAVLEHSTRDHSARISTLEYRVGDHGARLSHIEASRT